MPMLRRAVLAVALVAGLACSDGDVTLDIDLLSFLTDSGRRPDPTADYAVQAPPTDLLVRGVELVAPTEARLLEVIDDLTVVREGTLFYEIEAVNREGSADATIAIRLAGSRDGLDDAASIVDGIDLALLPGETTTADGDVALDDEQVALFANERVWIAIDADLRVGAATAPDDSLAGRLHVRGLDVRVVARKDFF
jgi:hypothetical protein